MSSRLCLLQEPLMSLQDKISACFSALKSVFTEISIFSILLVYAFFFKSTIGFSGFQLLKQDFLSKADDASVSIELKIKIVAAQ